MVRIIITSIFAVFPPPADSVLLLANKLGINIMISRVRQVEINYFSNQELFYREIARKTGHDRRTIKRYAENPDLIGRPRASVPHASKLDLFMPAIENCHRRW